MPDLFYNYFHHGSREMAFETFVKVVQTDEITPLAQMLKRLVERTNIDLLH